MTDTSDVLLAHIQSRINRIKSSYVAPEFGVSLVDKARLDELDLMLKVLRNANDLQRLALQPKETA